MAIDTLLELLRAGMRQLAQCYLKLQVTTGKKQKCKSEQDFFARKFKKSISISSSSVTGRFLITAHHYYLLCRSLPLMPYN